MKPFVWIVALMMLCAAASAEVPAPLGMTNAAIGGGQFGQYTPGVENGVGMNNIGLLIKTWGEVTFRDDTNKYFYINDGTDRSDGSGHTGIRVSYDNLATGNSISPPGLNTHVAIVGISSTVVISTKVQPNVRPRKQTDITPL